MDFETEKKLRFSYNDKLFDLLKFNEFLTDKKFIRRLATNKTKMLFGYLKDIRFYLKFINECEKRYPSFDIENIRKNCIIIEDFSNEILYISIKDKYNIKTLEEIKYMHFDVAIMNPPYDGNLHLKIQEKVIPMAEKVVNISPANCYISNRLKFSTDIPMYDTYVKSIFCHVKSVDIIKAEEATKLFGAVFGTPLAISICDKNFTDINYEADKFITYYNKQNEKSICKKILDKCINCHWETYLGHGKFVLNTSHVHGHPGNIDFTNLLCMQYKDALNVKKTPDARSCQFKFDSENERKNFYNCYMNSKLIHWWNYQWKNQIILKLAYIPYFKDYTNPWDDKRLCEYFGITGYISDTKAEPGSEWETILETMKEYV